jgi:hypothetical protein
MREACGFIPISREARLQDSVGSWFGENYARDCHVATHALSLTRVTPRLPSSRLSPSTRSCWYKQVDFQQWNMNLFLTFWLKNLMI